MKKAIDNVNSVGVRIRRKKKSILDFANEYIDKGWSPIPVLPRSKNPGFDDWEKLRLSKADCAQRFKPDSNIGVLLGEPSNNLIDIDLDVPEAVKLAPYFLPKTDAVFGRKGMPESHHLYEVPPPYKTKQFSYGGEMLIELRANLQTVFPPSIHCDSLEIIKWSQKGSPAKVSYSELLDSVVCIAIAVMLLRKWPRKSGVRQTLALAVAGTLLRAGIKKEDVEKILDAVTSLAKDEESIKRVAVVSDTESKIKNGEETTGIPTLVSLIGKEVVEVVVKWLRLYSSHTNVSMWDETEFDFQTPKEMFNGIEAEPEWIVENCFAKGTLALLVGKPKTAGKTTFLTHAIKQIIQGADFLGKPTLKTRCVYLSEQPASSLAQTLKKAGLMNTKRVRLLRGSQVANTSWETVVNRAIAECKKSKSKLLIIDTFAHFARLAGDKENNAGDILRALSPLQKATEDGIAVVIVHHERKGGGDVGDAGRGSSAITGAVDIVLTLRRTKGSPNVRQIQILSRFQDGTQFIELTSSGYKSRGSESDFANREAKLDILRILPPKKSKAISEDSIKGSIPQHHAKTTVNRVLKKLINTHAINRVGKGHKGSPFKYWKN